MHTKKQRGGTLLGLIIGLVVGLGLALAVAVYVTKVPVPFLNKGQTRNADQDAAETKKNKDWDPNAPLAGKPAAKPALTASTAAGKITADPSAADTKTPTAAETKPDAKTTAKTENKPDAKPDFKSEVKTDTKTGSNDPLGDLAKAKSSAAGIDPFTYFIQAGAYRTSEDAETQRAKLSLSGIEAKVTEREQAGRPIFRVRVGPFDKKDDADKTKERLDATGLDTALVRVQR